MRARLRTWLLCLVLTTVLQSFTSSLLAPTPGPGDCPTGTNWDRATQQCV